MSTLNEGQRAIYPLLSCLSPSLLLPAQTHLQGILTQGGWREKLKGALWDLRSKKE
jgi:hypothetical protein